jgi:hypothetical protein
LRRLRTTNLLVLAVLLIAFANVGRAEPATLLIEFNGQKRYFSTVCNACLPSPVRRR